MILTSQVLKQKFKYLYLFLIKATYVGKIIKGIMNKATVHHCLKDVMKCRLLNVRNKFNFNFKDVWI